MNSAPKKKGLAELATTVGRLFLFGEVPADLFDPAPDAPGVAANAGDAERSCPSDCVRCAGVGEVVARAPSGDTVVIPCPNARVR